MNWIRLNLLIVAGIVLLFGYPTLAQQMNEEGMKGSCPMCGAMGWGGLVLTGLIGIALVAVLVALTVFLIRRSRTGPV